ncbi:MAG TPA: PspC domain-containing protein [Candidatus Dormibacteraeota bacterium]
MTGEPIGGGPVEPQHDAASTAPGYTPTPPPGYTAPPPGGWASPPPGAPPPPTDSTPRRLVRRTDDRMIAGVASGLGAYLGVDPLLVRIGFVVLSFLGGVGVVAYVAAWLLVPSADNAEAVGLTAARRLGERHGRGRGRAVVGVILLAVAVLVLVNNLSVGHQGLFWGLGLIVVGVLLLTEEAWPGRGSTTRTPGPAAASTYATATYSAAAFAPTPAVDPRASAGWAPQPAATWSPAPAGSPSPPVARPRSVLGWVTAAVALLAVGTAALLDNAGVVSVSAGAGLALALIVIGLGLIVGAWCGRSRGLVVLGLALLPLAATAALIQVPLSGGTGDRTVTPATVADLQSDYRLGAGQLTVDLTHLDLGGATRSFTASVTLGQLTVVVPSTAAVDVHGRAGAGELDLLGHIDNGARIEANAATPGSPGGGRLHLDVRVGLGQVRVVQAGAVSASP